MPTVTPQLKWDQTGERQYEAGVSKCVLYPMVSNAYPKGVAWNGLTGVDENPDGAEVQEFWADNIRYASFRTPEDFKGNIKAYTYPDEWLPCDGQVSPSGLAGLTIGQQTRQAFGMCYRTEIGTDTNPEAGYILHLVYNCTVSPSSKTRSTKNENPDVVEFSWDFDCTPVPVTIGGVEKQTSTIELNSITLGATKMAAIEEKLYGKAATTGTNATAAVDAYLPLPDEVMSIISSAT